MISKELLSAVMGKDSYPHDPTQNGKALKYCFVESKNRKHEINIYELAFLTRDYLYAKYGYVLDMSTSIEKIFMNAAQFHKSML